jgi:FkbM family methyltransferase
MFYVLCRGYECGEAHLAKQYLRANDRVLEVGGGIGFLALVYEGHWDQTILADRGKPRLIPVIQRNLALNNISGVELGVRNAVLAGQDGIAEFNVHRNFWSSSLTARPGNIKKVRVHAQTLSTLMAEMPFRPNVLISDIEGGEENIDPDQFANFDKILIELHPKIMGRAKADALVQSLIGMGFENPQRGVFLRRHLSLPV